MEFPTCGVLLEFKIKLKFHVAEVSVDKAFIHVLQGMERLRM